jgi:PAS domain S-box-containing protein
MTERIVLNSSQTSFTGSGSTGDVLRSMEPNEANVILLSSPWLLGLLSAVEDLPISFSLATASKDRLGFPLIYVNRYFEYVTGYDRSEVIGQNCKFLQYEDSQQKSVNKLANSLKSCLEVKTVIRNKRKNGEKFVNYVCCKPVLDIEGKCAYVVGFQIDLKKDPRCKDQLIQMSKFLMRAIPSVIDVNEL